VTVKWRRAPRQVATALASVAESRTYSPSGMRATSGAIESMALAEMPNARSVPRMVAIDSSAFGAQMALMSIAKRPFAYPALLSRQLPGNQCVASRFGKATRCSTVGACA
jgi:hypothetical protein